MKSKNLVSLTLAAVFSIMTGTGLLIYFGWGGHFVDHIHAWFGILFFGASVFHIVNNWSSLKNYSVNRKVGGLRRELVPSVLVALVFTAGIAFDLPLFKDLSNAGKRTFGPKKKQERGLAQPTVDSIARQLTTAYALALSQGDTATLARTLTEHALIGNETGEMLRGTSLVTSLKESRLAKPARIRLDRAVALDDRVIVATGTLSSTLPGTTPWRFTNVFKVADRQWRIAALQLAPLPDTLPKVATR